MLLKIPPGQEAATAARAAAYGRMPSSTSNPARVEPPDYHPARLLVTTLILSSVWSLLKFWIAWQTASIAVLSDGVFSLLGVSANVVGLLVVWLEIRTESRTDIQAARRLQAWVTIILSSVLSLIAWDIVRLIQERIGHPSFRAFHLTAALFGVGSVVLAQLVWWLLARQGPQQRALVLSRQVGRTQNFTTLLAVVALPDLCAGRPALDYMAAGLIIILTLFSIFRMVDASINALAES
jgi:divalent metal cation (Fe/Co/Zn/Cd) transporter